MTPKADSIFCSICGADSQSPNAYCKRCGEWLPDMSARTRIAFGGETPLQNIFTGLFMSGLSTLAALFSAIALYATYLGSGDAKWSIYVTAAICLCIAGWQASSFIVGLKLRRRLRKGREAPATAPELGSGTSPGLNPADMTSFVNAPNITEHTTELLESIRPNDRDIRSRNAEEK